jgi:hypothetical protein
MENINSSSPSSASTTTTLEPISLDESKRLIELEKVINTGKQSFLEVGNALAEIRETRIYRSEHKSFDDYCRKRWGWGKAYAYQLIGCAEVKRSPIGDAVKNQAQAKELAKVPAPKRAAVIKAAATNAESAGRALTALDIKVAAQPAPVVTVQHAIADPSRPALDFEPAFELLNSIKQSAIRKDLPAYKSLLALETCLRQLASIAADLTKNTSSNN